MSSSHVKSAARVLQLLELFDRVQTPLTLKEITHLTDIPQSSAAALLGKLIDLSYIAHDRRTHEYVPTTQVSHLGRWIGDDGVASDVFVQKAIETLNQTTGETAVAAVRRSTYARYVLVKQQRRPTVVPTLPGVLRPICTSATGLALLSQHDDASLRRIVAQAQRERRGIIKKTSLPEVRQHLEHYRKFGFVISRGGVFDNTGMVAALLPCTIQGDIVALGIGGPIARINPKISMIIGELHKILDEFR